MNILITNIGRRGYLIDFLRTTSGFGGQIYASDCDLTASGLYGDCDDSFILPRPLDDEAAYVTQLSSLCCGKEVSLVIPVIDPEIDILSKHRDKLKRLGITVLVSNTKVLNICYDKVRMNEFFSQHAFNVAKTYSNLNAFLQAYERGIVEYPVFIKPIFGSGSLNSTKVENESALKDLLRPGMIIQEFLDGVEYGVDVFCNEKGQPVRGVVKRKIAMRSGETDKALTVVAPDIQREVIRMASLLRPYGPVDCDVIKTPKGIYIIDLNPRFGGGYPATHMAGVNFLELAIKLSKNEDIKPEFDNYVVGQLTMKDVGLRTIRIYDERYRSRFDG